jgi:hypothetical protein
MFADVASLLKHGNFDAVNVGEKKHNAEIDGAKAEETSNALTKCIVQVSGFLPL